MPDVTNVAVSTLTETPRPLSGDTCAAFTIATGKPIYIKMALALARSFLRYNRGNGIGFTIVTDRPVTERPADLIEIGWAQITPGEYGDGFTPKLYLDKLAPADRAIFIDADCLCVASLAPAFDTFAGRAVSVIGRRVESGEWFGDVAAIAHRLGVTGYPRFNGGVYYLERGEACSAIYDTAREILPRYDELGFVRLRNSPNDEVIMAAAMALHGAEAIPETGTIMNTLMAAPGGLSINVLVGHAVLRNPRTHPAHNAWYDLEEMRPALVHFLGRDVADHPYRTEILVLERVAAGWPDVAARAYATMRSKVPWILGQLAKNLARPLYRAAFGTRKVRPTGR
jgi:hypothetical protein